MVTCLPWIVTHGGGEELYIPADEEWAIKYQIVVPESYRFNIIILAHDT